jgi:hypothetical protein
MALTELQQVNALVGLSMRIDGWPSILADLGYTLDRIELKFQIPDPNRPGLSIYVNPDLLFVADMRNLSLIAELKSGTFQGFKQLDRLVILTPKDLIRYGRMPVRDLSQIDKHRISVMQVINSEFLGEYLPEFNRVEHLASLVSIDSLTIISHYGDLTDRQADRVFKDGIALVGCHIPTKLIPVLPTTDDEYELIESVVNGVKELWVNNARAITLVDIAQAVYKRLWERFDNAAKTRYLRIVRDTVRDMQETEFFAYLRPVPDQNDKWSLLRLPETFDKKNLTKEYQTFSGIAGTYKQRRLNNKPYLHRHASQTSFADYEGFLSESQE